MFLVLASARGCGGGTFLQPAEFGPIAADGNYPRWELSVRKGKTTIRSMENIQVRTANTAINRALVSRGHDAHMSRCPLSLSN